jgi:light-regulated signal transduction histidine kinase (bacteriophytochrome)
MRLNTMIKNTLNWDLKYRKEQEYLFQIKDNGIGIPQAYQQKIFYFSKLQNDDSSGIGLSIVKKNYWVFYKENLLESQEGIVQLFLFYNCKGQWNSLI